MVHPEASPRTDFNWQFTDRSDVEYIDMLDEELCVDSARVFAVAASQGGDLSTLLACQLPERIAAVASVTSSTATRVQPRRTRPYSPSWARQIPSMTSTRGNPDHHPQRQSKAKVSPIPCRFPDGYI